MLLAYIDTRPFLFLGGAPIVLVLMTWVIAKTPSQGQQEADVIFTFVEHPKCRVGQFSNELAAILREQNEPVVPVSFEVTRDHHSVNSKATGFERM
jgi:hypothetical protein